MKLLIFLLLLTQILYSKTLDITTNQENCNITINNKDYSKELKAKSLKLNLENGEYNIQVCKNNFQCFEKKIWIMDNDYKLKVDLLAIKSTLIITSNNINSIILINGKQIEKNKIIEFKKDQTIELQEKKDYFYTNKMKFKISLGNNYTLNMINLEPIQKEINIEADKLYKNVSIRVNGEEICKNTCKKNLIAGKYHLYINSEGFYPFEKDIIVKNENINIKYQLKEIPKTLLFGVQASYIYDRLLGGHPELDFSLKIKDRINFKLGLLYVVNFSSDSEYYGLILSSSYDIYKDNDLLELYAGIDLIFSKYIDNNIDYLLNGFGLNLGANFKIINNLFVNLELTSRLYYNYNEDYYNVLGKLGILYRF